MGQGKESMTGLRETLKNGKEYYEIRLESIGGLGANLCGKMLGELGVKYLDLNSTNFSSYGSEKTGTPVKGFIRYCNKEKEIRVHSPIVEPDLLVIFHQALLKEGAVWKGCTESTTVILALETGQRIEENKVFLGSYNIPEKIGPCYGLEAQRIAMETHSRINVVMLGAALKVMGLSDLEAGEQICRDTLGKKYPDALQGNLDGMKRGYEEVVLLTLSGEKVKQNREGNEVTCNIKEGECQCRNPFEWGYENSPIGGINPKFGNSVVADLSPSRQGYIPIFIKERCINCG